MVSRKKGRGCFNKDWWREKCYYACINEINAQGGNIRKLPPHSCRHTFSSLAFAAGIEPEKIAILMGHSDFEHTKTYIHKDYVDLNACISMIKA
jgi:integrase